MRKKWFWGLGVLSILVIAGVCYMFAVQYAEIRQLKREDAEAKQLEETMKQQQPIAEKKPPRPARAGYKWEWHEDHWHEMPLVPSDAPAVVKPKRSKGDPLNIDWGGDGFKSLDWTDPRTAESYRNYFGFDPPTEENYFKRVQDNFGTWIQHYPNTAVVVKWGKRIGFRPTVAQFARYKQLKAELDMLRDSGFGSASEIQRIEQELQDLVANAQGEIPTLAPRQGIYYGDKQTPEQRKIRNAEADRALYKRLGIEHLYEFYEVDPFK